MRVLAMVVLALLTAFGCSGDPESQAGSDPNRPAPGGGDGGEALPLSPDVDPCQLPGSVISINAGLDVDAGEMTLTGDGEGTCVYAEPDGDQMIIAVDTTEGSGRYDEAVRTTGGRTDIDSVGDETFWADPVLHVLSSGNYWTFELQNSTSDELRRQTSSIAIAQALEL